MSTARRMVALSAAVCMAWSAFGQLTQPERKQIDDALFVRNLTIDQLKTTRQPLYSGKALNLIEQSTRDPLGTTDVLLATHTAAASGAATDLLASALRLAYPDQETGGASINQTVKITLVKGVLRDVLSNLASSILSANDEINGALSKLTPPERVELGRGLPRLAMDTDGSVPPVEVRRIRSLIAQVDLPRIRGASIALTAATEDAANTLAQSNEDLPGIVTVVANGLRMIVTPRRGGIMDVGSADLVIALGGHNSFRGSPASGVMKSSVLIDLGQGSTYDTNDQSLGCGLLGIGIALVRSGDCVFKAGNSSLGCGLGGVGVFYKTGGNDFYQVGQLGEGFGQYGVGLCADTAGLDNWTGDAWVQGAARTDGIGWLVDRGDNPLLVARGVATASRSVTRADSQGYSAGYGNDLVDAPGGLGLLTLLGTGRTLQAASDSQGAAECAGVGSVYAKAGTSTYTATERGQAVAAHGAFGSVLDAGGQATFSLLRGIGQASAIDESVAVLLARGGQAGLSNGDAPSGFSDSSSLSLVVSADSAPAYRGVNSSPYRFPMSVTAVPVSAPLQVPLGARADLVAGWFDEKPLLVYPRNGKPGTTPITGDMERLWNQATARDPDSVARLLDFGRPALEWGIRNRLSGGLAQDRELMVYLTKQLGGAASPAYASLVVSTDVDQVRQGMRVAANSGLGDGVGLIPHALTLSPGLKVESCLLAAKLRAKTATPQLLPLLIDADPTVQRAAMYALSVIADESTIGSAQAMLGASDAATRNYAIVLLGQYPQVAQKSAESLFNTGDETQARTALMVLGQSGSPDDLETVAKSLKDARPGMKATALYELDGRFPPDSRDLAKTLRTDSDERVRRLATQVKIDPL